nr:MAG TPA: hypothetical protein [Caudoviricetes sp.]
MSFLVILNFLNLISIKISSATTKESDICRE